MFYNYFDEYTNFLGPIAIFLIVLLVLISIVMYIFGALGLMALAKKNKLDNPWLAFIPVGNSYLLGKLGFEVYSSKEEKNPTLTWILFGASLASCIGSFLENIASIVTIVFMVLAYNRIYKNIVPQSATKYTILSFFFGGIPFYLNKDLVKEATFQEEVVVEKEEVNEKEEEVKEETKELKKERPNFCSNCGNKLTKSAKFCPECGQEIK